LESLKRWFEAARSLRAAWLFAPIQALRPVWAQRWQQGHHRTHARCFLLEQAKRLSLALKRPMEWSLELEQLKEPFLELERPKQQSSELGRLKESFLELERPKQQFWATLPHAMRWFAGSQAASVQH